MAENKNSFEDILTNLALVTDGIQTIFPNSKSVILYELTKSDFNYVKSNFKNLKFDETQIKIDMSGTEVVFILENSIKEENKEEVIVTQPKNKERFFDKILRKLTPKKGS